MKKFTTLRWVSCMLIVSAGGLFSCESKPQTTGQASQQSTTQNSSIKADATELEQEEAESTSRVEQPRFNPDTVIIPTNQQEYNKTIEEVKLYKRDYPNNVTSNYFSRELIDTLLSNPECRGIRVYRSQEANKGKRKIVITGVDKNGKEIPNKREIPAGKFQGEYLIGISYEKCPNNCGELDQ